MTDPKVNHVFTFFESLGGVQSVLRHHYENDSAWQIHSKFTTVFEREARDRVRVRPLAQSGLGSIRSSRLKFSGAVSDLPAATFIYHNLWGLPIFADLDQSSRRIGVLHSDWPTLRYELAEASGLIDGLLCVSDPLMKIAQEIFPSLASSGRIRFLPYPIQPSPAVARGSHARLPRGKPRSLVIGFCGRLVNAQKRIDRLPPLCERLDAEGLSYTLEILGTGPEEPGLRRRFSGRSNVQFHGLKKGEDYWRTVAQWDAILFTSDYEGLPIALLEAMSVGAVPIYPAIASGGDEYARRVAPECLFDPKGTDFVANACRSILWLSSRSEETRGELAKECIQQTKHHSMDAYFRTFSEFYNFIRGTDRISTHDFQPRPCLLSDHLPFALLERVCRNRFFIPPKPRVRLEKER